MSAFTNWNGPCCGGGDEIDIKALAELVALLKQQVGQVETNLGKHVDQTTPLNPELHPPLRRETKQVADDLNEAVQSLNDAITEALSDAEQYARDVSGGTDTDVGHTALDYAKKYTDDKVGTVPSGKTVMGIVNGLDTKVKGLDTQINAPNSGIEARLEDIIAKFNAVVDYTNKILKIDGIRTIAPNTVLNIEANVKMLEATLSKLNVDYLIEYANPLCIAPWALNAMDVTDYVAVLGILSEYWNNVDNTPAHPADIKQTNVLVKYVGQYPFNAIVNATATGLTEGVISVTASIDVERPNPVTFGLYRGTTQDLKDHIYIGINVPVPGMQGLQYYIAGTNFIPYTGVSLRPTGILTPIATATAVKERTVGISSGINVNGTVNTKVVEAVGGDLTLVSNTRPTVKHASDLSQHAIAYLSDLSQSIYWQKDVLIVSDFLDTLNALRVRVDATTNAVISPNLPGNDIPGFYTTHPSDAAPKGYRFGIDTPVNATDLALIRSYDKVTRIVDGKLNGELPPSGPGDYKLTQITNVDLDEIVAGNDNGTTVVDLNGVHGRIVTYSTTDNSVRVLRLGADDTHVFAYTRPAYAVFNTTTGVFEFQLPPIAIPATFDGYIHDVTYEWSGKHPQPEVLPDPPPYDQSKYIQCIESYVMWTAHHENNLTMRYDGQAWAFTDLAMDGYRNSWDQDAVDTALLAIKSTSPDYTEDSPDFATDKSFIEIPFPGRGNVVIPNPSYIHHKPWTGKALMDGGSFTEPTQYVGWIVDGGDISGTPINKIDGRLNPTVTRDQQYGNVIFRLWRGDYNDMPELDPDTHQPLPATDGSWWNYHHTLRWCNDVKQLWFSDGAELHLINGGGPGPVSGLLVQRDNPPDQWYSGDTSHLYIYTVTSQAYYWNGTAYVETQVPTAVAGVIQVDTYDDLPDPGDETLLYVTIDTDLTYYWNGTEYKETPPTNSAVVRQYASYNAFPSAGDPAFIYIARDTSLRYAYINGEYKQVPAPQVINEYLEDAEYVIDTNVWGMKFTHIEDGATDYKEYHFASTLGAVYSASGYDSSDKYTIQWTWTPPSESTAYGILTFDSPRLTLLEESVVYKANSDYTLIRDVKFTGVSGGAAYVNLELTLDNINTNHDTPQPYVPTTTDLVISHNILWADNVPIFTFKVPSAGALEINAENAFKAIINQTKGIVVKGFSAGGDATDKDQILYTYTGLDSTSLAPTSSWYYQVSHSPLKGVVYASGYDSSALNTIEWLYTAETTSYKTFEWSSPRIDKLESYMFGRFRGQVTALPTTQVDYLINDMLYLTTDSQLYYLTTISGTALTWAPIPLGGTPPPQFGRFQGEYPTPADLPLTQTGNYALKDLAYVDKYSVAIDPLANLYVVVSMNNNAAWSEDGVTWHEVALPDLGTGPLWHGVANGKGTFVTVANGSNLAAYSKDGKVWTASTLPSDEDWIDVLFFDDRFVAIAYGSAAAAYSDDGITWHSASLPVSGSWSAMAKSTDRIIAVSDGSEDAAVSFDGIAWSTLTMSSVANYSGIAWGNGVWVATTRISDTFYYSTNEGSTWTSVTTTPGASWSSVTYGNGKFVAVSTGNGYTANSANGASWTILGNLPTSDWERISFMNGYFVVCDVINHNAAQISTDGITWTQSTLPADNHWYTAAYGTIHVNIPALYYILGIESSGAIQWQFLHELGGSAGGGGGGGGPENYIESAAVTSDTATTGIQFTFGKVASDVVTEVTANLTTGKGSKAESGYDSSLVDTLTWTLANGIFTAASPRLTAIEEAAIVEQNVVQKFVYDTTLINVTDGGFKIQYTTDDITADHGTGYAGPWNYTIELISNLKWPGTNSEPVITFAYNSTNKVLTLDMGTAFTKLFTNALEDKLIDYAIDYTANVNAWGIKAIIREYSTSFVATDTNVWWKFNSDAGIVVESSGYDSTDVATISWVFEAKGQNEASILRFNSPRLEKLEKNAVVKQNSNYNIVTGTVFSSTSGNNQQLVITENVDLLNEDHAAPYTPPTPTVTTITSTLQGTVAGVLQNFLEFSVTDGVITVAPGSLFNTFLAGNSGTFGRFRGYYADVDSLPTTQPASDTFAVNDIAYVAAGPDSVYVYICLSENNVGLMSYDGINWEATNAISTIVREGSYGDHKFVGIAESGNYALVSANGIDWQTVNGPSSGNTLVSRFTVYGNGKYVGICSPKVRYAAPIYATYSYDGVNWVFTETSLTGNMIWFAGAFGNDTFVAVGYKASTTTAYAAYSTDGINWTEVVLPLYAVWRGCAFGNGLFVIVGPSSSILTSPDGITWTQRDNALDNYVWRQATFGNGKFLVTSQTSNAVAYSDDGITWSKSTIPSGTYYIVFADNGKYFVGGNSTLVYSTDLVTWTQVTRPFSASFRYLKGGIIHNTPDDQYMTPMLYYVTSIVGTTITWMPLQSFASLDSIRRVDVTRNVLNSIALTDVSTSIARFTVQQDNLTNSHLGVYAYPPDILLQIKHNLVDSKGSELITFSHDADNQLVINKGTTLDYMANRTQYTFRTNASGNTDVIIGMSGSYPVRRACVDPLVLNVSGNTPVALSNGARAIVSVIFDTGESLPIPPFTGAVISRLSDHTVVVEKLEDGVTTLNNVIIEYIADD